MKIMNMNKISKEQINQAAQILTESIPEGWPDFQSAYGRNSGAADSGKYHSCCYRK